MRPIYGILVILFAGCLAVESSHNPVKQRALAAKKLLARAKLKHKVKAKLKSNVKLKSKSKPKLEVKPKISMPDIKFPPDIGLSEDKVGSIKELFLIQHRINQKILKMAKDLSDLELININLWLRQYGVQIQRKLVDKQRNHREFF
jgi:hypothetical protein